MTTIFIASRSRAVISPTLLLDLDVIKIIVICFNVTPMVIQFKCDEVSYSEYGIDKRDMVKNIPYIKRKLWFVYIVESPFLTH